MGFAQHAYMSEDEKIELQHQRDVAKTIKEIEQQSGVVMGALAHWLRQRSYRPKTSKEATMRDDAMQAAMDRLIKARQSENALFRELFGIEEDRLAIAKPADK